LNNRATSIMICHNKSVFPKIWVLAFLGPQWIRDSRFMKEWTQWFS
jgi:hypothetical protein